jgi:hypothetical protein
VAVPRGVSSKQFIVWTRLPFPKLHSEWYVFTLLHGVSGCFSSVFYAFCLIDAETGEVEARTQAPQICTDDTKLDRRAFHRDFNSEVVAFFKKTLAA